jgi:hypothetical protein
VSDLLDKPRDGIPIKRCQYRSLPREFKNLMGAEAAESCPLYHNPLLVLKKPSVD